MAAREKPQRRARQRAGEALPGDGARDGVAPRLRVEGHRIGRPRVTDRPGFSARYGAILERIRAGAVSRRQAARELDIGYATLKRLLDARSLGSAPDAGA